MITALRSVAVILCGGKGARLPKHKGQKCMAQTAGRPFLEHLVDRLITHHDRLIFACGHKAHEVIDHFNLSSRTNPMDYFIETGGQLAAINKALSLQKDADLFFFYNGDTLLPDFSYDPFHPLYGLSSIILYLSKGIYQSAGIYYPKTQGPFTSIEDILSNSSLSFYKGPMLQINTEESLEETEKDLSERSRFTNE